MKADLFIRYYEQNIESQIATSYKEKNYLEYVRLRLLQSYLWILNDCTGHVYIEPYNINSLIPIVDDNGSGRSHFCVAMRKTVQKRPQEINEMIKAFFISNSDDFKTLWDRGGVQWQEFHKRPTSAQVMFIRQNGIGTSVGALVDWFLTNDPVRMEIFQRHEKMIPFHEWWNEKFLPVLVGRLE